MLQNVSHASDRCGHERAQTIIANHRARLFCSGIGDSATLEHLRSTLGEGELARVSQHRSGALVGLQDNSVGVPRPRADASRAHLASRERGAGIRAPAHRRGFRCGRGTRAASSARRPRVSQDPWSARETPGQQVQHEQKHEAILPIAVRSGRVGVFVPHKLAKRLAKGNRCRLGS